MTKNEEKCGFHYFYIHETNVKHRWLNRSLINVLESEYKEKRKNYFKDAIKFGAVLVNKNKKPLMYTLKHGDVIHHIVHIHEPAQPKIEIITEEEDFIVVNKPSGIPCHPTVNYRYFTVTKSLEEKYGKLSCINRLDVPTSGILILANKNVHLYHNLMTDRCIKKIYLALVNGNFTDENVSARLKKIPGKYNIIDKCGKDATTNFRKIAFDGVYSLVECVPLTGRTHQIRVHLQSIGYPIVNDLIYGGEVRKPKVVKSDLICDGSENIDSISDKNLFDELSKETIDFVVNNCEAENSNSFKNLDSEVYLHAFKYFINDKLYTASLPKWAEKFEKDINKFYN